jgi:DNA-binding transcriptional LysR family regulator
MDGVAELTLTGMRIVSEVAARGSLTAAARALGYTQSAVSRQVALMEAAVGAELFERLPRGVRPTARGRALLAHAHAILDRADAALLEQARLAETLADRLVLGAFPTALSGLVPRALSRLAQEHPAITVALREGGTVAQLRRVRAGRVHVAVIAAGGGLEYDLDDLEVDVLLQGAPLLAVAAGHRLAGRSWVNVAELRAETWIVGVADDDGPQFGPWPTLEREATIGHALRDWPARLGLVAAGLGVAVIPSLLADALPPGVRAVRVEDPRPLRREVLAVTRPGRPASVQALIDALRP